MRYTIDHSDRTLRLTEDGDERVLSLDSPEAFDVLRRTFVQVGWGQKYSYAFTWLGRPVIQLPADLVRLQEAVVEVEPDVIVETGIAHGGSVVFHASLCAARGRGRVIGVDIEIRPHNRAALEAHPLREWYTLIEGDAIAPAVVQDVASRIRPDDTVMVLLDSAHSRAHVAAELEAYAPMVTPGSYLVVADGIMAELAGVPGAGAHWEHDHPVAAVRAFLSRHPEFEAVAPPRPFDEGHVQTYPTYFPDGWLRRRP